MQVNIITADENAEQFFVGGCVQAIIKRDLSNYHVLAKLGGTYIYLLTKEECTFISEILWESSILEIVCIINRESIQHFHNEVKEYSVTKKDIRDKIASFLESMKSTTLLESIHM